MADTSVNYGLLLPDTGDFVTVGSQVSDNFETIDTELKRVDDLASNPSEINGRLWRTSGFVALATGADPAIIDFEASRVKGGMTAASDGNSLIIPVDGFYDVRVMGYATGGATDWTAQFFVNRVRAAVADKTIYYLGYSKDSAEDFAVSGNDIVALKANDQINIKGRSVGASGSTWGVDELSGIRLFIEYKRPLDGVVPL